MEIKIGEAEFTFKRGGPYCDEYHLLIKNSELNLDEKVLIDALIAIEQNHIPTPVRRTTL